MPQVAKYWVWVALTMGAARDTLRSDPHTLVVPDIMAADEVEKQLHERMVREWFEAKQAGMLFDLESIAFEDGMVSGGRFAVNPEHVAWLNTELISLEPEQAPEQPTPPAA